MAKLFSSFDLDRAKGQVRRTIKRHTVLTHPLTSIGHDQLVQLQPAQLDSHLAHWEDVMFCAKFSPSSTPDDEGGADDKLEDGYARTLYLCPPMDFGQVPNRVIYAVRSSPCWITPREELGCKRVVLCLDQAMPQFGMLQHGLCYVGG